MPLINPSPSSPPPPGPRPTFSSATPRLYVDCSSFDASATLGTLTDFRETPFGERLIFAASLNRANQPSEKVFVKLTDRPYGIRAHRFLERHNYAPKLYGRKILHGAPTAYVMEYLDNHWKSLSDLLSKRRQSLYPSQRGDIKEAIDRILTLLERDGFVHGDFRSNNIMVNLGDEPDPSGTHHELQVKVVDFDWAGEAGVAEYPVCRNDYIEGITWPRPAGDVIQAGDDRFLFNSWWPTTSA
jgi:serine/threonine protein kinase